MMILYVVRHGETDFNAQGRYAGSTDVQLSQTGITQARELALSLAGQRFDAAVSSPMLRARQTSDIVLGRLNMAYVVYEEFAERNVGVYEGLTRDEARERYPDMWNRQCTARLDDAPDGGETIRQVCERVESGIERIKANFSGSVLLICHGFVSRAINRYCLGLTYEQMLGFSLGNCKIISYTI